jgi:RNA polymerase sigma-70 factor (ECF subfamily)
MVLWAPVCGFLVRQICGSTLEGDLFEQFREYLNLLARLQVGSKYRRKIDPSAVVNATLYAAHRHGEEFRGSDPAEIVAWLRQRLAYDLADAFRVLHRDKRDIDRERPLEQSFDSSDTRITQCLEAIQSSPSERAAGHERSLRLASALARLPEAQRDAVELHHLQGHTISEVAEMMGRTNASVAGLLRRGLNQLRELLCEDEM